MTKLISHIVVFLVFFLTVLIVLLGFITYPLWFWKVDTARIEKAIDEAIDEAWEKIKR
jgi:hypothetical protein